MEDSVQILFRQIKGGQIQQRVGQGAGGKRVGAGQQVADVPVAIDEGLDRRLLEAALPAAVGFDRRSRRLLAQGETVEKGAPLGRQLGGRLLPETILGFQPLGAGIVIKGHAVNLSGERRRNSLETAWQ
jgi:hypothetical protein